MRVSAATVQSVIRDAVRSSATAIHFEPQTKSLRVAYRVDDRLVDGVLLPYRLGISILSHLKKMASLHPQARVPQEGQFPLTIDNQSLLIRVSTLPLFEHEKIVMHIINTSATLPSLPQLGLWGQNLATLQTALSSSRGLILTSGPINAGVTTTLYNLIQKLHKPEIAITTIEDSITQPLEKIIQVAVQPQFGLTYPIALKGVLRQDPNVIMIGNLYDSETTHLVIQQALGGRLLLANIYAPSVVHSIQRLLDFGVEPFLLSNTLKVITSQRLVRTLCANCKEAYKPEKHEVLSLLHACLGQTRSSFHHLRTLELQAAQEGLGQDIGKSYSIKNNNISRLFRARPSGCNICHHSGYKGKIGIFEVMPITPKIQTLLTNHASNTALRAKATEEGMLSLQTDGLIKTLRGETSSEELLQALGDY